MQRRPLLTIFAIALFCVVTLSTAQTPAQRATTKVAGDVYRYQNNFHFGLLVLTKEGVITVHSIIAQS